MSKPGIFTQYCDDVRREADGRPSLMGVYPGNAVVEMGENKSLPKICVHSVISLPLSSEFTAVTVITTWDNKKVAEVDIPESALLQAREGAASGTEGKRTLLITTVAEIRDLDIGTGGVLRTQVRINGNTIDAQPLRLDPATKQQ